MKKRIIFILSMLLCAVSLACPDAWTHSVVEVFIKEKLANIEENQLIVKRTVIRDYLTLIKDPEELKIMPKDEDMLMRAFTDYCSNHNLLFVVDKKGYISDTPTKFKF